VDEPSVDATSGQSMPNRQTRPARKAVSDAEGWLADHGDALYRYARLRVHNREAAEDLVQEAFLAAIKSPETFRGAASVRTWLVSILRRKIVDHYRKVSAARAHLESDVQTGGDRFGLFSADGQWVEAIAPWKTPPQILEDREFWSVLDTCLGRLPRALASAFVLRELMELETAELRDMLSLSPGNLRVRLFRARQLLRECLEKRWFGVEKD
jgi:RNA polymerase sigma-70 factor (ECF subfamily)